jgi:dienelactone hydrolase
MHRSRTAAVGASLALATALGGAALPAAADSPTTEYTGTLAGADYRVVVPAHWDGTLVLFSHGHFPGEFFPDGLPFHLLANSELTEQWLLDHGVALAASQFQNGGVDYTVTTNLADNERLLDWFEDHVGAPRTVIAYGQSMGGVVAVKQSEVDPRVDAAMTVGGVTDPVGALDTVLDVNVATAVLLTDGTDANGNPIEIVRPRDPQAARQALLEAIGAATETKQGRARLALIASLATVPPWYAAHEPRPASPEAEARAQAAWIANAYTLSLGPTLRPGIEAQLGGNPSTTVGVRHGRQLVRAGAVADVRRAYRAAGLSLRADLRALDAEPRIAADPAARAALAAHRPGGTTRAPVLTLHTLGDGGAPASGVRGLADQVRRAGDPDELRGLWVARGGHLTVSPAEEITALRALLHKVRTGRWPDLSPRATNQAAGRLDDAYAAVFDVGAPDPSTATQPHDPAFVRYLPPRPPRPSW